MHSYNSNKLSNPPSGGKLSQRASSRPSTAQQRLNGQLSKTVNQSQKSDQHLPDINMSQQRLRPSSAMKGAEAAKRFTTESQQLEVQSIDQYHVTVGGIVLKQDSQVSEKQAQLKDRRESMQKSLTQRSEDIRDYDRKSAKKQDRPSQVSGKNEDIRSQIQIDDNINKSVQLVDLPPPIQNTFMISGENNFGQEQNKIQPKIDVYNIEYPDQESSQIGQRRVISQIPQKVPDPQQQQNPRQSNSLKPANKHASQNSSANIMIKTQGPKKKRNHQNQFKEKSMNDKEVIEFLIDFCSTRVSFQNMNMPADFDSTDNLDSFLMALLSINLDSLIQIDNDGLENIHLATGTRTQYCRSLVMAIIEFQNKEVVFADALEFFQESMNKMIQLSAENQQRREQIDNLESAKQDLTIKMFDYQKKLTDTSTALLKLRQTEFEQAKTLAAVKKQLDHKKAECESLTYMIKNNLKQGNPSDQSQPELDLSELHVPEKNTEYIKSPVTQMQDVQLPEQLPVQNQNLAILQAQMQKISIENRQNLDRISEMQIQFENKDRLISHLEHNISEMLVEREKNVIRLKSEIVILQNKVSDGEENFKQKLLQMRQRVEADEKTKVKRSLESLQEQLDSSKRYGIDQQHKIQRLQDDYAALGAEFQNYRKEKVLQENARETYLKDIEGKYKTLSEQYSEAQRSMISKLDAVTSQSMQKQNENEVLYLRLKYLKQITDNLKRQKLFLQETLVKSRNELSHAMQTLEEAMISQNKSKSYLISVEKSIKQTRDMSELGTASLLNIENIVKFLKVEKMHELVFEVEPPSVWQEPEHQQDQQIQNQKETIKSNTSAGIKLEQGLSFKNKQEVVDQKNSKQKVSEKTQKETRIFQVQSMLDSLKNINDMPVQFRPKHDISRESETAKIQQIKNKIGSTVVKNEEYYLEHCPIELCSILLKFIVQELVQVEVVQSVEQIPFSISRLLFLANGKSDLIVEKELFDQYLIESKKILDDEISHLSDQINTLNKLKEIAPIKSRNKNLIVSESEIRPQYEIDNNTQEKEDQEEGEAQDDQQQEIDKSKKLPLKYNVLSMRAFDTASFSAQNQISSQVKNRSSMQMREALGETSAQADELVNENLKLKNEIQQHQIVLVESKQRQKEIQIGLATEIVELQERIESLIIENEERLVAKEIILRQETEKIKLGCQQREAQFLSQIQKLQDVIFDLESNTLPMNQADRLKTQGRSQYADKAKVILDESKLHQSHSDHIRSKKSIQSLINTIEEDKNTKYQELTRKFENYQENVQTYIEVRESNRNTISIVFDASEANQQMVNESIIKLYLSKIYNIPNERFRLLSSQNFVREASHIASKVKKQSDDVVLTKILVEIVEEREMLQSKSAKLRAEINDGSSLLFDLMPSYVCFNLGLSGLATRHKLNDCRLLQKQGLTIDGIEFIVTLLRHKSDPYVFMAIAINMGSGEEYVLEMQQQDILTLIEGDLSLLESNQNSIEVQALILQNLVLLHNDAEGKRFLSCEQKVYFNTVLQSTLVSKASTTVLQKNKFNHEASVIRKFEIGIRENPLKNSIYAMSTMRDSNLADKKPRQDQYQFQMNDVKTRVDQDSQTDFAMSVLYEAFNLIFSGLQKVSEIVEVHITVEHSSESNTLKLQFQDLKSLKKIQFCILANNENQPLNQDSDEEGQDQVFINSGYQEQYFIHTQCITLEENHIVLVSVEKLQNSGLLIKLHDLKMQASTEVGLFMKSNGQMSQQPIGSSASQQPNETFRQLVFDLTFNAINIEDHQQNQTIAASYLVSEDKMLSESKDPQLAEQQLFQEITQKNQKVINKLSSKTIVIEALKLECNPYARHSTNIESFKQLQERGLLLYRDSQYVRVSESLAIQEDQINNGSSENTKTSAPIILPDCRVVLTLCSLHIKDRTINIEVFLFKNQKISVTSSVQVDQLFVGDPRDLSHSLRAKFIKQILEKLFIVEVAGKFEMKIEQNSENISDIIANYEQNGGVIPNSQNSGGQEENHALTVVRNRSLVQRNYEDKTREFQIEKNGYVQSGRAVMFSEYVTIGELSQVFELRIYILLKKEKKLGKMSTKRLNTFGKTQLQIETQKLEQHIDDYCDFETIYLETADPITKDPINILIDKKRLVQILVKDITVDWSSLVINWRQKLIPYIKHCILIDTQNAKIILRNTTDIGNLVIAHCQSMYGSKIAAREEQAVIETFKDECAELLDKILVLNQEIDFAEFSYDIKMFRISKKSYLNDGIEATGVLTFAYHIEIFNINEPENVYKYRMPISAENSVDPITFTVDVFNLVHHETQPIETSVDQIKTKNDTTHNRQKLLVRRYVDNNLILVVQHNKFPSLINLMVLESSSGLSWNCTYEPNTEITSLASFCLLDISSLEKFFNSVYDSLQPIEEQVYQSSPECEQRDFLDWNSIEDATPVEIIPQVNIDNNLSLSILKHRGILKVTIFDREQKLLQQKQNSTLETQQNQVEKSVVTNKVGEEEEQQQNDFSDLHGAYAGDTDCIVNNMKIKVSKIDIRIKNIFSTHMVCKVLLKQDGKHLVVKVITSSKSIHVIIQNIVTMKIIFHYVLNHPQEMITDIPKTINISEIHQARHHIYHAISSMNTKHVAQEMVNIHNQWLESNNLVTQNKYTLNPNQKSLTLHRRVFYDEQRENLILITAEVVIENLSINSDSLFLPHEINSFTFRLEQPEQKTNSFIQLQLSECVTDQSELNQLNRKDIARLKILAKKLLEDRTELKYKADNEFPYILHFNTDHQRSQSSSIKSGGQS